MLAAILNAFKIQNILIYSIVHTFLAKKLISFWQNIGYFIALCVIKSLHVKLWDRKEGLENA